MKFSEIAPLIERMKGGDQKAFDELHTKIWDSVYYIALRQTNNHNDALDVTQDVLITVNKEIYKLSNLYAFSSWLHRITYNKCIDYARKRDKFETVFLGDVEDLLIESRTEFLPADVLTDKETKEQIMGIIDDLSVEQKEVLLLYYFEQMPTEEIAATLGVSQNAVYHKLSRARARIKKKVEQMNKTGFTVNSVVPTVPVLTQILLENSTSVCTNEIQSMITKSVVKLSAPVAKSVLTSMVTKIFAGVVSMAVIVGVAIIATQTDHPLKQEQELQNTNLVVTETEQKAQTLEDFVGTEGAALILFGKQIQTGAYHEQLKQLVKTHSIVRNDLYFDREDLDRNDLDHSSYIVYYLDKQDKRLLLVERYDAVGDIWQIAYQITDKLDILPNKAESIQLFQEYFKQ